MVGTKIAEKSGNKEILVNRVFGHWLQVMNQTVNTSIDNEELGSPDSEAVDVSVLKSSWKTLDSNDIPPLMKRDIDNYFKYQKNPTTGNKSKFWKTDGESEAVMQLIFC